MYWTVYYESVEYFHWKLSERKKMIGVYTGGNTRDVLQKACRQVGCPFPEENCRSHKEIEYNFSEKKDTSRINHLFKISPIDQMISIK